MGIIFVLCSVTVAAAAISYLVWRWWRALAEVRRGLEALGSREKARQVLITARGPVGKLVRAFNTAATEIQTRTAGLDQDRQQLLVVLGAMTEAVIAVDPRRRLLFANASANRLFGLDSKSVGRLVPELIRSPRVQDAFDETLRLTIPAAFEGEVTLPGRDSGQRANNRLLSVRGNPLPGRPSTGAVLVFHDVTELRRLERMRQDFVANASHELKTPLASIKAYTETLLDWALHDDSVNNRFLDSLVKAEIENFGSHFQDGPYGDGSIGDEKARWAEFKAFRSQFACKKCSRTKFQRPFTFKKPVCAHDGCEAQFEFAAAPAGAA